MLRIKRHVNLLSGAKINSKSINEYLSTQSYRAEVKFMVTNIMRYEILMNPKSYPMTIQIFYSQWPIVPGSTPSWSYIQTFPYGNSSHLKMERTGSFRATECPPYKMVDRSQVNFLTTKREIQEKNFLNNKFLNY